MSVLKQVVQENRIIPYYQADARIDGKAVFIWEEKYSLQFLEYIPRIGEKLNIDGRSMRVTDIEYKTISGTSHYEIAIHVKPVEINFDYHDYLKAFSHTLDSWKSEDDPTRAVDCKGLDFKYDVKLPETKAEWLRDLKDLRNGVKDVERRSVKVKRS